MASGQNPCNYSYIRDKFCEFKLFSLFDDRLYSDWKSTQKVTYMYVKRCSFSFSVKVYRKKPFVCFESRKSSDFIDKAKTIHTIYTAGWPRQGVKPGHLCTYVLKPLNKQACEHWRKQSLIFHSLLKKKLVRQSA